MNIGVALAGAGSIDANFKVSFLGGSGGTMRINSPPSLGTLSGDLLGQRVNGAWDGDITASPTSGTPADGTIFAGAYPSASPTQNS